MKKILNLGIGIISLIAVNATNTFAAFPIKQSNVASTESTATVNVTNNVSLTTDATELNSQVSVTKTTESKSNGAEIPKGLYILLAIFGLGWLGMGINSDWDGYDWVISLLLYILFWLPGLIYSLIKMKNYY